jgi:putative transposase
MLHSIEATRRLWNDALAHRKTRWESDKRSTSYNMQAAVLTSEREKDAGLGGLHSQVAQDVLRRLDKAMKSFFGHRAKHPKFKKRSTAGSFTYPQAYNGSAKPDVLRRRLYLSKVGNIRTVFHRPLPKDALPKTCTVVREPDGRWFASLVFEDVVPLQDLVTNFVSVVGIDLGLKSLIVTSDGMEVEHPRFLRKAEKRLKHLQRALSRKKKGSKNRFKARRRVASQHARVRRQRTDFNHKLSTQLVKAHELIALEDLRIRNMMRNHKLAKSIQDAGWGQLVRFTEYKALSKGKRVVRVNPVYSTQECFHCGTLNKIALDVREFDCVGCGRHLRRDLNASCVVLKRGLAKVGQDMPELKPVETGLLLVQTTGRTFSVSEAGTICASRALESHGL